MGDAEGQREGTGGSREMQRLAGLTQSLREMPEGFSWGKLVLRS